MRTLKIVLLTVLILVSGLYGYLRLTQALEGAQTPPSLTSDREVLEVSVKDPESALYAGLTATDDRDGDLTGRIRIAGISKFTENATAKVTYLVFDSDDRMATLVRPVRYTDYTPPRFSITEPLIYYRNQAITLLDRLFASDVLDGDITNSIRVSSLSATSDPETYLVSCQVTNSMGDTVCLTLPVIQLEGMAIRPEVVLKAHLIYIKTGTVFNAESYLAGVNLPDGVGKAADVVITGTVDTSVPGTYMVRYTYPYEGTSGTTILTVVVE